MSDVPTVDTLHVLLDRLRGLSVAVREDRARVEDVASALMVAADLVDALILTSIFPVNRETVEAILKFAVSRQRQREWRQDP